MVALIKIAVELIADVIGFAVLLFRPTQSIQAENLFLRRQLALFKERGVQPRRIDTATRISLVILARYFDWRDALFLIGPKTMIRWQRAGWRLFWKWKLLAWTTEDSGRASRIDPEDGSGEPGMGRGANRQ